jgi:hypothetical protein
MREISRDGSSWRRNRIESNKKLELRRISILLEMLTREELRTIFSVLNMRLLKRDKP